MNEAKQFGLELVKKLIETNYNRYFKCADVVDDVIAHQNGVSVKYLMDCRKCHHDPYDKFRRGMTVRVAKVLAKLRDSGVIERYNSRSWRIVK